MKASIEDLNPERDTSKLKYVLLLMEASMPAVSAKYTNYLMDYFIIER